MLEAYFEPVSGDHVPGVGGGLPPDALGQFILAYTLTAYSPHLKAHVLH